MRVVPVHTYGIAATLRPKDVAELFPATAKVKVTKTFVIAQHEGDHFVVAYDFGAVVFFDCSDAEREALLKRILEKQPPEPHKPLLDDYLIEVRDGATSEVSFDRAIVSELNAAVVELIALVLAQSVAMDYYEEDVQAAYAQVAGFALHLAEKGHVRLSQKALNVFVGNILATRNQIAMTLSLLDAPAITWEREVYDRLYRALRGTFEIDERHRTLEHKIGLIQDNLEIIVDLAQHRRGQVLELIVIALIAFEVIMTIFEKVLKK